MAVSPRSLAPLASVILAVLALGACGETRTASPQAGGRTGSPPPSSPGPEAAPPEEGAPPRVTVRFGRDHVALPAFSYCYGNICADGMPPASPPDVGSPAEVEVDFPIAGWTFDATFVPAGERCGRAQTLPVRQEGDGPLVLRPAGFAGTYDVTLFGRGDGDLVTVFRWSTPTDGPLPRPESRLAVLADHDGEVDSYGVELDVSNLAATPERAEATITVTAADGAELTFDAARSSGPCRPEGSVYWDGPDREGLAAARLGPAPFAYRVVLLLDGVRHEANARWPADVIRGNEPSVGLSFTPPLPAL
jgi:hypothetical protein